MTTHNKIKAIRRRAIARWDKFKYFLGYLPAILVIAAILLFLSVGSSPVAQKMIDPSPVAGQSGELRPTPTPTDEQMIKSLPHGDLVWKTYGHESTWGQNDACRSVGRFNGFGYGMAKGNTYPCYSSLQEVATAVSSWFEEHLKTMTVRQALCHYNQGTVEDDCDYAEYSLSL